MKRLVFAFLILAVLLSPASAASSRVLPSAYVESTYCASGCDYSSLAAWEAATDVDLNTDGGYVLTVQPGTYNDKILFQGATNQTATKFRVIRGSAVGGAASCVFNYTGSLAGTTDAVVSVREPAVGVYDLTLRYNGSSAVFVLVSWVSDTTALLPAVFSGAIWGPSDNTHVSNVASDMQCQQPVKIYNSIAHDSTYGGFIMGAATSVLDAYNMTVYNQPYGFYRTNGTGTVKNVITQSVTDDYTGAWSATTCVSDDSVQFVDAASGDFRLAPTDTAAKGQGTDLSATFTDDIAGSTRTVPWDIGAWMYTSSGLPAWKRVIPIW